jgi:hypothetical protein
MVLASEGAYRQLTLLEASEDCPDCVAARAAMEDEGNKLTSEVNLKRVESPHMAPAGGEPPPRCRSALQSSFPVHYSQLNRAKWSATRQIQSGRGLSRRLNRLLARPVNRFCRCGEYASAPRPSRCNKLSSVLPF